MRTLATAFCLGVIACLAVQVFVVWLSVAALRRVVG
jgi:hypothetical protein